jgi:hypothetical protein
MSDQPTPNLNPNPTQPTQPNPQPQVPTNVLMLTMLYDSSAADLQTALATHKISFTDERIKGKVQWLGEVAKALSLVYQVEMMRNRSREGGPVLPAAQKIVDPALVEAQKNKLGHPGHPGQTPGNLGGFPSPGGWRP